VVDRAGRIGEDRRTLAALDERFAQPRSEARRLTKMEMRTD
jgi:hypothetical protein